MNSSKLRSIYSSGLTGKPLNEDGNVILNYILSLSNLPSRNYDYWICTMAKRIMLRNNNNIEIIPEVKKRLLEMCDVLGKGVFSTAAKKQNADTTSCGIVAEILWHFSIIFGTVIILQ